MDKLLKDVEQICKMAEEITGSWGEDAAEGREFVQRVKRALLTKLKQHELARQAVSDAKKSPKTRVLSVKRLLAGE